MSRAQVRVRAGVLEGREKDGVLLFAGIPYAAPPTGALRFRAPEPHPGWSGVRPAQRFGPGAPQLPGTGLTAAPIRWDEDCLTLNVCTPAADDAGRPVLVWIHGGGFRTGKGGIPWYNGASFARRGDVVTVTLNYRLGVLGFADLRDLPGADDGSAGVRGLRDQIAALEWVRDNIAAFGGDPARVTVAGESAGAMSVGALLGSPRASGLFRGAVAQSGAAHHVLPEATARALGRELAALAGARDVEALRALPVEALLDAQARLEAALADRDAKLLEAADIGSAAGMPFQPALDGDLFPEPPLDAVRAGAARDVALLVGTNADETTLWDYGDVTEERLARIAGRLLGDAWPEALDVYRSARPGASPAGLLTALTTDHLFRIPAIRLAEAHAGAGGRAFQYWFTWRSRAFGGRLGATHALDIPFVFHTLDAPGVDVFLGEGPAPTALADAMHAAWIRFVREGTPGGDVPGLSPWPTYDPEERAVMELGEAIGVRRDPGSTERRLWDGRR